MWNAGMGRGERVPTYDDLDHHAPVRACEAAPAEGVHELRDDDTSKGKKKRDGVITYFESNETLALT